MDEALPETEGTDTDGSKTTFQREAKAFMGNDLSENEVEILRGLARGLSVESVAKSARIPPLMVGEELARLQLKGYLSEQGKPTEKALKVVRETSP